MKSTEYELHNLGYCRKCLNETFKMNLKRKHCYIYLYPMKCGCCGESKRIVCRVRFPYNILLRFRLKKRKNK